MFVARYVFCNQLINYLLTGYPILTENTKPSASGIGDFGLSIFQCRLGNQLINRRYCIEILVIIGHVSLDIH